MADKDTSKDWYLIRDIPNSDRTQVLIHSYSDEHFLWFEDPSVIYTEPISIRRDTVESKISSGEWDITTQMPQRA